MISVSLHLPQGVELYTLRLPPDSQDSFKRAILKSNGTLRQRCFATLHSLDAVSVIADVFAQTFRQLIELQVEEKYLLQS